MADPSLFRRHASRLKALAEPSTVAVWAGVCLAGLVIAAASYRAVQEYRETMRQELARSELLAGVLNEQAARSFETLGVVLAAVGEAARDRRGAGDSPELRAALSQALAGLPFVRGIALVDAGGTVIASSVPAEVGLAADPGMFQPGAPTRNGTIGPWHPGRGLATRATAPRGVGFIPYRQPVREGEAEALIALVDPGALLGFQSLALEGSGRSSVLATFGGRILAVTGDPPKRNPPTPGADFGAHPLFEERAASRYQDSFTGEGLSGERSVVALRASRAFPLVSIVERPVSVLAGEWRAQIVPLAVMAFAGVATIAAMTAVAFRSLRSREAVQLKVKAQYELTTLLLEASPVPVSMTDREGNCLAVNAAWEEFTGVARGQALSRPWSVWMPEEDMGSHRAVDARLFAEGGRARYETRMRLPGGRERDVLVTKVVVNAADASGDCIFTALADITDIRDAERATRDAKEAAEEASRTKSEFIANISHELRTPLQAIIGFSELGMGGHASAQRAAAMFGHVHESGNRMLALVNDLLDVSRLESALGTFHFERADLRGLVRTVAAELAPLLQRRGVTVDLRLSPAPLVAKVDALRFQQVIRNVLANAIRFSPAGSQIVLTAGAAAEGTLACTVRDHGPGIPEAELEKIFEAFVQSSLTKDGAGGSGLGLAICRKIMDLHGGTISASNVPEGGACISIALPAAPPRGATQPAPL